MKKSIVIIIVTLFSSIFAKAQYDAMFTQYMFNEMYINPAYAGSKDAMAVNLSHRQQWVNFPGRPITTSFTLHGPLANEKMGLGISLLNEQIGKLNRNLAYLNYAYRLKVSEKGKLSFGLMGGIHNQVNKLRDMKKAIINSNKSAEEKREILDQITANESKMLGRVRELERKALEAQD